MKKTIITIFLAILSLANIQAQPKLGEPNAYLLVFLDKKNKPIANATIFAPAFRKDNQKPRAANCKIVIIENKSKSEEVAWFNRLIPKSGNRQVEIETRKNPDFGGGPGDNGAHVDIEFNPGIADGNINATLSLEKKELEGTWSYGIYEGGFEGGKVKVTRIQIE